MILRHCVEYSETLLVLYSGFVSAGKNFRESTALVYFTNRSFVDCIFVL